MFPKTKLTSTSENTSNRGIVQKLSTLFGSPLSRMDITETSETSVWLVTHQHLGIYL